MASRQFATLTALSPLPMGFLAVAQGAVQMKRRPLLVSSKYLIAGRLLVLLPVSVACIGGFVADVDSLIGDLLGVAGFLLFMIPIVMVIVVSHSHLTLLNVTEAMVFDSLCQALRQQGIQYSQSKSPTLLTRLYKIPRFIITLSELGSSIEVTINPGRNAAVLRFKDKHSIPNYSELVAEFRTALESRDFDRTPLGGLFQLFFAVVAIGVGLYILFAFGK